MHPRRFIRPTAQLTTATFLIFAIGATRPPATTAGISYTIHTSTWTGTVAWAAGRGRIDVVDGPSRLPCTPSSAQLLGGGRTGCETVLKKGDYVLFDSTDFIIVHPDDKTFFGPPTDLYVRWLLDPAQLAMLPGSRQLIRFADANVSVDPVEDAEAVDGRPTHHYRMTTVYAESRGDDPQVARRTMNTDYWLASVPDFPPNPFLDFLALELTGRAEVVGIADLTEMMRGTSQSLLPPGTVALRMTASSLTMVPGAAGGCVFVTNFGRCEQTGVSRKATIEISGIKPTDVDLDRLVLPAGFRMLSQGLMRKDFPDDARLSAPDGKWRVKPSGAG